MRLLVMWFVLDALQTWRAAKLNAAVGPLAVLSDDVVGYKSDLRGTTDEFVFPGAGPRRHKGQYRGAIRRSYSNPSLTGLKPSVVNKIEPELIEIEPEASIL